MGILTTSPRFAAAAVFTDPTDIAGLVIWFDASDSGTITQSGGLVSQWDDKSGNGYHATEVTNKPTTGADTLNSLNVLTFDGDRLASAAPSTQTTQTIFVVGQITFSAGSTQAFVGANPSQGLAFRWNNSKTDLSNPYVEDIGTSTGALSLSTYYLWTATYNSSTGAYDFRTDGASDGSGTNTTTFGSSKTTYIGATGDNGSGFIQAIVGNIAEVVKYDTVLSAGNITAVEDYLNAKWAVF